MNALRKDKTPIAFKAQAGDGTLTLDMFDVIGADFFGEGITAAMVSDALKGDTSPGVTLNINSPGGDAFEGVAIYNVLKACGKPIAANVMGMAASAASIVAMAGDAITMLPGSVLMIHNAMGVVMGNSEDCRKLADVLDTVSASIADIYVARTKNGKKSVLEMMAAETWMDAKEAVEKGFATEIGKTPAVKNSFDLSVFRNAPEALKAEIPAPAIIPAPADTGAWKIALFRKRIEIEKSR